MNTDRFLEVADVLRAELEKENRVYELLATLAERLKENDREGIEAATERVLSALANARSNEFAPSRRAIVREIGGENLIGKGLADRLKALLEDYRLSPGEAAKVVQDINKEVQTFYGFLNNLAISSLRLGLEPHTISPGECEVGVLYPKPAVISDLDSLVHEARDLDHVLRTFMEIGGASGSPRVSHVSSSDIAFYFSVAAGVGYAVSKCIDKVLEIFHKKLEIDKARLEVEKLEIDVEIAKQLKERGEALEEKNVDAAADFIVKLYEGPDGGRRNELRLKSKVAVRFMVEQIKRGVIFEVTASSVTSKGLSVEEAVAKKGALAGEARQLAEVHRLGGSMRELAAKREQIVIPARAASVSADRRPSGDDAEVAKGKDQSSG